MVAACVLVSWTYRCYHEGEFIAVTYNYEVVAIRHGMLTFMRFYGLLNGCLNTLCAFPECMLIFAIGHYGKLKGVISIYLRLEATQKNLASLPLLA